MFDIRHPAPAPRDISCGAARSAAPRAALLALVLVALVVAPTFAGSGPTRLSDASVSVRSGSTADVIAFTVAYRNREGSPADWVRVTVGSATQDMVHSGGEDWKQQVWFTWTGTLSAGIHAITFQAMSRDRFDDSLDGGTVTITVPPPPPPAPTPEPTAAPTLPPAAPTVTPTAPPVVATTTPKPAAAPMATPRPTTNPRTTPVPTATPGPPSRPTPTAVAVLDEPTVPPASSASTPPSSPPGTIREPVANAEPSPAASDGAIAGFVPGATPGMDVTGGDGGDPSLPSSDPGPPGDDPLGVLGRALTTIGLGRPELPFGLLLTMTTTTGVVGAATAFSVFGRRRRDGEQPDTDEVLAESAASGVGVTGATALAVGVFGGPAAPSPADLELAMPRWRRPSLLEARKADPNRDGTVVARLTFDHGLVGPLDGRERRLIRYSVVRLLDTPDELRGSEIGFLDSGDEVQLLEKRGVYWLVLCPDGREGWIHKMTLGEASVDPAPRTTPTATMPIDADTWTMGEDADIDVLTAYLESRRRT